MAKPAQQGDTLESVQTNINRSMDTDFDVLGVEMLGYDGTNLQRVKTNTSGEITLSNVTLEGVGVFDSFEQVREDSVGDTDSTLTFAQEIKSAHILNVGDQDCYINFDATATTAHYKLKIGESYPAPLKFTVLHAITDTGTTDVRTIGYF